jgi:hypothetical protein
MFSEKYKCFGDLQLGMKTPKAPAKTKRSPPKTKSSSTASAGQSTTNASSSDKAFRGSKTYSPWAYWRYERWGREQRIVNSLLKTMDGAWKGTVKEMECVDNKGRVTQEFTSSSARLTARWDQHNEVLSLKTEYTNDNGVNRTRPYILGASEEGFHHRRGIASESTDGSVLRVGARVTPVTVSRPMINFMTRHQPSATSGSGNKRRLSYVHTVLHTYNISSNSVKIVQRGFDGGKFTGSTTFDLRK